MGVESCEETLRWLWDENFSAVVGDQPSFEAWPCQNTDFWLHEWLLAGWGMPIGELFDLERLSEECKKRERWSFFFSSMPLKVGKMIILQGLGISDFIGSWRCGQSTKWCCYILKAGDISTRCMLSI